MRIRCFIAMAFGRADTDQVFNKVIAPTLRRLKVSPIRVDIKEHNRNINEIIMEELDACSLVVADLTYARPSVYFEAGYAERKVPVVYTSRKDHFRAKDSDPNGNERVHFDVSMRNIVGWSSPSDKEFRRRFEKRVKHVIRPICARLAEDEKRNKDIAKFSSLSFENKDKLMSGVCAVLLKKHRYIEVERNEKGTYFVTAKVKHGQLITASILSASLLRPSDIKQMMELHHYLAIRRGIFDHATFRRIRNRIASMKDHVFLCTSKKFPKSYLKELMSYAQSSTDGKELTWIDHELKYTNVWNMKKNDSKKDNYLPREIHLHILDGVQSDTLLRQKLEQIIEGVGL